MTKHPPAHNVGQHTPTLDRSTLFGKKLRIQKRVEPISDSDRRRALQISLMLGLVVPQIFYWITFFSLQRSQGRGGQAIAISIVIASIVLLLSTRDTIFGITVALIYTFSSLIYLFSILYWGYGSATNFSIQLTRLDAIYFAIGTLTTAGTGNISATSDLARGLQALQMGLDFMIVVFAVALVTPRLIQHAKRVINS